MSDPTKEEIETVANAVWEARREMWRSYRFDADVNKIPNVLRDSLLAEARVAIIAIRRKP